MYYKAYIAYKAYTVLGKTREAAPLLGLWHFFRTVYVTVFRGVMLPFLGGLFFGNILEFADREKDGGR